MAFDQGEHEWMIVNPGCGFAHIIDMHNETWDQQDEVEILDKATTVEGVITDDDIGHLQKPLLTQW
eukprot:7270958-Ditylum_brightwellii.AAC.1